MINRDMAALGVIGALALAPLRAQAQPARPRPAPNKIIALAAPAYRATLQKALDDLKAPKPGALKNIVTRLDVRVAVRRADGQVQSVSGNYWSSFARGIGTTPIAHRAQTAQARAALQLQLSALDEWTSQPVFQPVDAKKIVTGLASSGQIRVGPLWWQSVVSNTWAAIVRVWDGFWKWLRGLLPTPKPFNNTAAPSDKWLWFFFSLVVAGVIGAIVWFLWRVFGGTWMLMWGQLWGRRRKFKSGIELQNEDAELLQLPPEELLSRAERFATQGNFREALRHRYLSLLLDLDARGVWRYDARRTNWEHIAALGRSEVRRPLVAPLSDLTKRFDRVRYGDAPCDDAAWRRFDADARGFETQAAPLQKALAREVELTGAAR